jgi:hypothetical protein
MTGIKKQDDGFNVRRHGEIQQHHKEQEKLKNFMIITFLSITCYAIGYSLVSRVAWDLGSLIFPEPEYPYLYQFLFSIVFLLIIFIIALKIVFKTYTKLGKSVDDF